MSHRAAEPGGAVASAGGARRGLIAVLVAFAALASTGTARSQEAVGDAVTSGGDLAGQANTQAITVAPFAGRLALPVKLVAAGSRIEGDVTRASAAALDLGLLGALG